MNLTDATVTVTADNVYCISW